MLFLGNPLMGFSTPSVAPLHLKKSALRKKLKRYFVYLLQCADGTYYAGSTKNIKERIKLHNAGRGAKYVRGRTPVRLVYSKRCGSLGAALRREIAIKQLTRRQKELLIRSQKS